MRLARLFVFVGSVGLLSGCVAHRPLTPQELTYSHFFVVKDGQGAPLAGAKVQVEKLHWTINDAARPSCSTDQQGRCYILLTSRYDGVTINGITELTARISKPGYVDVVVRDGRGVAMRGESYYNGKESESVVLLPARQHITVRTSLLNRQRQPVPGGRIAVLLAAYGDNGACTTDKTGVCATKFNVADRQLTGLPAVKVTAEADGMFPVTEVKQLAGDAVEVPVELTVASPFDYLCEPLRQSGTQALPSQVARWVVGLQIQAYLQDTKFSYGDVCTSVFKGKKYASIHLKHEGVYNSLRSNSYQIGTKIFDDVIRKMIQRMAQGNPSFSLDGYDISLDTASGDATRDYSDRKALSFRFILPKSVVQKYIDKDITGQQLINQSVVLLNDERIDLHLQ